MAGRTQTNNLIAAEKQQQKKEKPTMQAIRLQVEDSDAAAGARYCIRAQGEARVLARSARPYDGIFDAGPMLLADGHAPAMRFVLCDGETNILAGAIGTLARAAARRAANDNEQRCMTLSKADIAFG